VRRAVLRLAVLAALALNLGAPQVSRAEFSAEDYGGGRALRPEPDRPRAQALIDAARRRETEQAAEQERARQAEDVRQRVAEAAREAHRPPGERLADRYCAPCHGPERIDAARHTRLGWSFTVARMRYLNRAQIPAAEASVIAAHLARTQPADLTGALLEYGLALGLVLAPVAWVLRRRFLGMVARRRGTAGVRTHHDLKTKRPRC
jgi:hypothetical protein